MNQIKYTLLSDGSSNKVLLSIIEWLLRQYLPGTAIDGEWADLGRLPNPLARNNIPERIKRSLELHPCDLLFIHRDAEGDPLEQRIYEINEAIQTARTTNVQVPPTICIVPVRMLEAWFLFDLNAIRRAAGNPSGAQTLTLPPFANLENLLDPKDTLHNLLRDASGLHGRRLKSFNPHSAFHLIPGFIEDFGQLRALAAFQRLESDIRQTISSYRWA
jgi:hypothetical protein